MVGHAPPAASEVVPPPLENQEAGPPSDVPPVDIPRRDAEVVDPAADLGEGGDQASDDDDEEPASSGAGPLEFIDESAEPPPPMEWYIIKVQSNRESSVADALRRKVKIAGLDPYFEQILVPTEDIMEYRNGKRRVTKRKLYPGYIVVKMAITDDTWFLVRETPGIGDFTGSAGKPSPMLAKEIERILPKPADRGAEMPKTAIPYKPGDKVRIKEGTFENFEGEVHAIDEANGRVTVMISIFGRSTPTELAHWQIEEV